MLPAQLTLEGVAGHSRNRKPSYEDTVWTIQGATHLDRRYRKWKVDLALDARQTLVSNTRVRIGGLRIGLEHRRVHRFGFGFYGIGDGQVVQSLVEVDERITSATLSLDYTSLFYERVMYFSKRWEWSLTGHMGIGEISGSYRLPGETADRGYMQRVVLFEGSTTLYYHLTYFMSLGAGIGYRGVPDVPEELRHIYSSPVAIARLRIRLFKMVRGIFNKEVRTAW